uniref:Uncharacterized protein n=1 Tax=Candidatus Kentrum sp. FW TaxID=2126338 RepID=A0A450TMJ3_9GAMM|nr:MAG: hypothetical protein BECKFW1821B_GA0114236_11554 [Candidatus Kentron sp. FW]
MKRLADTYSYRSHKELKLRGAVFAVSLLSLVILTGCGSAA